MRPGMTMEKIIDELDKTVRLPGLANLWVMPIRNRIDMLSTGVKTPSALRCPDSRLPTSTALPSRLKRPRRRFRVSYQLLLND